LTQFFTTIPLSFLHARTPDATEQGRPAFGVLPAINMKEHQRNV
jgi:hypothetical protein